MRLHDKLHHEGGQALVLALVFLIFAGLVIAATLTYAYSSELSTQRLGDQRNTVYAADSAMETAIHIGRKDATLGAYGDPRCQASIPNSAGLPTLLVMTTNGVEASVVCTWSSNPLQPDRSVTFSAFITGQIAPIIRANVIFHDSWVGGTTAKPVDLSWTYCIHGATC